MPGVHHSPSEQPSCNVLHKVENHHRGGSSLHSCSWVHQDHSSEHAVKLACVTKPCCRHALTKIYGVLQVVPTRRVRNASAKAAVGKKAGGPAAGAGASAADESAAPAVLSADDLLPRADISGAITSSMISNLNSAQAGPCCCRLL